MWENEVQGGWCPFFLYTQKDCLYLKEQKKRILSLGTAVGGLGGLGWASPKPFCNRQGHVLDGYCRHLGKRWGNKAGKHVSREREKIDSYLGGKKPRGLDESLDVETVQRRNPAWHPAFQFEWMVGPQTKMTQTKMTCPRGRWTLGGMKGLVLVILVHGIWTCRWLFSSSWRVHPLWVR